MPFTDVKRAEEARGRQREQIMGLAPQVADLGGGKFYATAGAKDFGETSPNFYDDPTVSAIQELPSLAEAQKFTGASPSFYGVQRPGDWQRVVQRKMAAEALPGGPEQLAKLVEMRVLNARRQGGLP